jgi:hypothetical protein
MEAHPLCKQCDEEILFVLEMGIDGSLGPSRKRGDLSEFRSLVPVAYKDCLCSAKEEISGFFTSEFVLVRQLRRHLFYVLRVSFKLY